MLRCIWPPLEPQGHKSIFWKREPQIWSCKSYKETFRKRQQRAAEMEKEAEKGQADKTYRSSSPQYLLQASFWMLPPESKSHNSHLLASPAHQL